MWKGNNACDKMWIREIWVTKRFNIYVYVLFFIFDTNMMY